jgi:hypothetical protein
MDLVTNAASTVGIDPQLDAQNVAGQVLYVKT